MTKGKLFVISGPSGAGKSTVIGRLVKQVNNVYFSVSATTREPRRGEREGKDYFFVSYENFEKMIEENKLLEYAQYVGNYYGTPAEAVDEKLEEGFDVVLDIETKGAAQVMERRPNAIGIFLFPGSYEILRQRLMLRSTDSPENIEKRMRQAYVECSRVEMYKYIIINDRVETAVDEAIAIITAEKCMTADRLHLLKE